MGADSPQLPTATSSTSYSRLADTSDHSTIPQVHHHQRKRSHHGKRRTGARGVVERLKQPIVYVPTICFTFFVIYGLSRIDTTTNSNDYDSQETTTTTTTVGGKIHDGFNRLSKGWSTSSSIHRPNSNDDGEWTCNPFEANGRLNVDLQDATQNEWRPFDQRCKPSNLLKNLYRPPGDTLPLIPERSPLAGVGDEDDPSGRKFLPWFRNRTIVFHGDSIDRFHLKDFCEFVGGHLELISPDHPACPAMWKKPGGDAARREMEENWANRPREGCELTSPWVCDVKEYGTTLVNVFTWGLEGAEEFFQNERWYYPPATWIDRMDHITLPLLPRLAKYLDRPQIENPDLVILNSGYWDLRKYTEEDFVAAGFPNRPYPEDSPIPYTALSPAREQLWEREARKAIKHAAKSFRGKEGKAKNGPTLLWRSLHHPPRHNYAPFPRVFQLDSLARKVISDLQLSQPSNNPSTSSNHDRTPSSPLSKLSEYPDREDLGLNSRLRIDESGKLMLGQEHLFRDLLHPLPIPGSWIWADIMLYELKRAIEGVDR